MRGILQNTDTRTDTDHMDEHGQRSPGSVLVCPCVHDRPRRFAFRCRFLYIPRRPMADTNPLPAVTLYTDGGADPNPGTGGWAAILLDPATGKTMELSGG